MEDGAEQDEITFKSALEALGLTQAVKELTESVETVAGKIDRIEQKVDRTYAQPAVEGDEASAAVEIEEALKALRAFNEVWRRQGHQKQSR